MPRGSRALPALYRTPADDAPELPRACSLHSAALLRPRPPKELQPTGRALGEAEGEARGETKGKAQALLDVLKLRGLDVPEEVRDRILACTDLALLDGWFARSLSVHEARDLFDEPDPPNA